MTTFFAQKQFFKIKRYHLGPFVRRFLYQFFIFYCCIPSKIFSFKEPLKYALIYFSFNFERIFSHGCNANTTFCAKMSKNAQKLYFRFQSLQFDPYSFSSAFKVFSHKIFLVYKKHFSIEEILSESKCVVKFNGQR